jgi:hypothetical protein
VVLVPGARNKGEGLEQLKASWKNDRHYPGQKQAA